MSQHNIESVCHKYKELKDCAKYRDICGVYGQENKLIGYYLIYLIATRLNGNNF